VALQMAPHRATVSERGTSYQQAPPNGARGGHHRIPHPRQRTARESPHLGASRGSQAERRLQQPVADQAGHQVQEVGCPAVRGHRDQLLGAHLRENRHDYTAAPPMMKDRRCHPVGPVQRQQAQQQQPNSATCTRAGVNSARGGSASDARRRLLTWVYSSLLVSPSSKSRWMRVGDSKQSGSWLRCFDAGLGLQTCGGGWGVGSATPLARCACGGLEPRLAQVGGPQMKGVCGCASRVLQLLAGRMPSCAGSCPGGAGSCPGGTGSCPGGAAKVEPVAKVVQSGPRPLGRCAGSHVRHSCRRHTTTSPAQRTAATAVRLYNGAARHSAARHRQHSAAQHSAAWHGTAWHSTAQPRHSTAQHERATQVGAAPTWPWGGPPAAAPGGCCRGAAP
jgi:hypothetical protein